MVQLWFQASTNCTPRVGVGEVTCVEKKEPAPGPAPVRAVVTTGKPTGTLTVGLTELTVWAVPIEIVACDGTNSGSVTAWARLKNICLFVRELSEEARSAVL